MRVFPIGSVSSCSTLYWVLSSLDTQIHQFHHSLVWSPSQSKASFCYNLYSVIVTGKANHVGNCFCDKPVCFRLIVNIPVKPSKTVGTTQLKLSNFKGAEFWARAYNSFIEIKILQYLPVVGSCPLIPTKRFSCLWFLLLKDNFVTKCKISDRYGYKLGGKAGCKLLGFSLSNLVQRRGE